MIPRSSHKGESRLSKILERKGAPAVVAKKEVEGKEGQIQTPRGAE